MPPAIEKLEPALWDRLVITQQVREEDMERVRAVYAAHGIKAYQGGDLEVRALQSYFAAND